MNALPEVNREEVKVNDIPEVGEHSLPGIISACCVPGTGVCKKMASCLPGVSYYIPM